jgi:putative hemolysin
MLSEHLSPASRLQPRLMLSLAHTEEDVREAQRLRHKVFIEEMGASPTCREEGIDRDIYDPYCDHLLVRDRDSNEVVGTYRMLTAARAKEIGGFYSQNEFDLTRLANLSDRMVEVGRSCVHPDFRGGAVIALLWEGLARYMQTHRAEYLMGCASISISDGGHVAASLYHRLKADNMSPIEWRVFPRYPLPLDHLDHQLNAATPPLIKGYLRVGAYICGDPAWDPDFNTADLLILLPMSKISARYARHFVKTGK